MLRMGRVCNLGLAAIILLLAGQIFTNIRLARVDSAKARIQQTELPAIKWSPRLFQTLTLGNVAAAVDWLWIRAVTDPSQTRVRAGTHPLLYFNLDLATDIDPAFFDAYMAGANLLAVLRDDGEGARSLLLKGERFLSEELPRYPEEFRNRYWRQAWTLPLLLGYVCLFELDDLPSAAEAFKRSALLPGAPPHVLRLAERLQKPGGQYEVGLRLLNFMIASNKDPRVRERLENKRTALVVAEFLFTVNEDFDKFKEKRPRGRDPELARLFSLFVSQKGVPMQDPAGGRLSVDETGRIVSSTPKQKVFGLE